ncbi:uncharacterized protein M6B38_387295 [Iris pallida]|uniref:FCP1 homology domain-containing protein n=1 Tax=Iris pallida TaxID=29817 RepID=A0AAX6G218_IRIPA|nr:uncharacterized protein M6B38_387295 [Iris pallida]
MGKGKTLIPGPQPEQPKRKKRKKQSVSIVETVNSVEEKSPSCTLDVDSNTKKKIPLSQNTMEPLVVQNVETSLQATEFVLPGKDKECVSPVDNAITQSVQTRRFKRMKKNRSTDISFKDNAGICADSSALSDNAVIDSISKTNYESVSVDQDSLVDKNQAKNVNANLVIELAPAVGSKSFKIVDNTSVGSERSKSKKKHNFEFSPSTQEDASIKLQAGPNFTDVIGSSAAEITTSGLVSKTHDQPARCDLVTSVPNEGGLSIDADADTSKNLACLEIDLKSNDLEISKSKKKKRSRKQKHASSNTIVEPQVDSFRYIPSLVENVEEGLEKDMESSVNSNLGLPVANEICGIEKDPYNPIEVKGPSSPVEVKGPSNTMEIKGPPSPKEGKIRKKKVKQSISEERPSANAVEQKNEDSLVPLLIENTLLERIPVQEKSLTRSGRKLLVLDLNGLLCDVVHRSQRPPYAHKIVGKSSVFKRPFCDDFLKFCYERFVVGVWSSRLKENVQGIVSCVVGDAQNLSFCWDISRCTLTGYKTIEDEHKPLVLKELKKLWNKEEADLPWEVGDYSPSNTLLIDDSPYKALCNPPHTGIFPHPYSHWDKNDNSLGPGGDLRVYLEGLSVADDVQQYVQEHPFGKRAITAANASWEFYKRVMSRVESTQ